MNVHLLRTGFLAFLILVVSSTAMASAPEIESVEPWPSDVGHGDTVHVDAEVSGAEDVWYVATSNGEKVGANALTDRNSDGYYVAPVGFRAEGGNTYTVKVKACDSEDRCSLDTVDVEASCTLGLAGGCVY